MSIQHPFTEKINLERETKTVGGNKLKAIIKTESHNKKPKYSTMRRKKSKQ
jgi:hypothetical protein